MRCDGFATLEIKPGVATVTTGEAARDTTLVERTAARQPNISPKMRVDDPDPKPQNKQYEKENNFHLRLQ